MTGQVFVVAADLTKVACDAWLLPTDDAFTISESFQGAVGGLRRLSGVSWGNSRVIPFTPSENRIWLADIGGTSETVPRSFVEVLDEFASEASRALASVRPTRRPVLAVNVLGTGEGGGDTRKGAVHSHLMPALYEAADEHDVDLVLTCWGRQAYSAAQRQRRRHLENTSGDCSAAWDLGGDEKLRSVGVALAERVRTQHLVLFLGAGVSAGVGLPLWGALIDEIASETNLTKADRKRLTKLDFRDQAAVLERRLGGRDELAARVAAKVSTTNYAVVHGLLASLRCREAVTTNYDPLYEEAMAAAGPRPAVLPYEAVTAGEPWILKLHGSADRPESIVLSRSDYLGVPATHGALFGLVQAMLLTRHMLFVGYSLSDEDFHQLVDEVRRARRAQKDGAPTAKLGTVLTLFEDPLFEDLWAKDLDIVAMAKSKPPRGVSKETHRAAAARRLSCLLDYVAFEAADVAAFLLDKDYDDMLEEPDESSIAKNLRRVYEMALESESPVAARVRRLLDELAEHDMPDGVRHSRGPV